MNPSIQDQNEQSMQDIKVIHIQRTISITKRRARLQKTTTLLQERDEQTPFEDSRVTMWMFEKYRLIELVRLYLIVACTCLTVIEYEYSFTNVGTTLENELRLLLYIILIMSILIIILTILSYQVKLIYKKEAMLITPKASLMESPLFYSLLWELILLIPTSTPFTRDIKIYFTIKGIDNFYYLNELLTYIMLFRSVIVCNILLKFNIYYNSQVARLCRLYSAQHDTHLTLKLMTRDRPALSLSALFLIGMFVNGYTYEIAERPIQRDHLTRDASLGNSFWATLITVPSIGYGDQYPVTFLGRLTMTFCVFYGVSLSSLFVTILLNLLYPTSGESMVWALLTRADASFNVRRICKRILTELEKARKEKAKQSSTLIEKVSFIALLFQECGNIKRAYRDIDGEEFLTKVKRKFKENNQQFEEYRDGLKRIKNQQKFIGQAVERPMEFSFKSNTMPHFLSSQKKSVGQMDTLGDRSKSPNNYQIASGNTHEKQSKDEQFFDNLEDDQQDPYLMNFEDN